MPPTTISISFSGLCSFVADSWPEQPGEIGSPVDVLLLDTQHSAVGAQLCRHFPCMSFSEIGKFGPSLVKANSLGRRSVNFQSVAQAGEPRIVNGILPLSGLSVRFGVMRGESHEVVPLTGNLTTEESFKEVLALEELVSRADVVVDTRVSSRWRKSEAEVAGIVGARTRILAGSLGAHSAGTLGEPFGVAAFSKKEAIASFRGVAPFVKWNFTLVEDARRFVIRVFRGKSLELELQFAVGEFAPQIAISNLCGLGGASSLQGGGDLPGDDIGAFYDLTEEPVGQEKRFVVRSDRDVDTGTLTCPPVKQTVTNPPT